jgi:hypothetical protein
MYMPTGGSGDVVEPAIAERPPMNKEKRRQIGK